MKYQTTIFPSQKLSSKLKNDSWKEACVDYVIGMSDVAPGGGDKTYFDEMQSNYDLYLSKFDKKDLKYVTDPFNQEDGFPASPQNFNIIKPKIDLLIGEEYKRPFNFKVARTSQSAVSDMQEKMKSMVMDYMMAKVMAGMSPEDAEQYQAMLQSGEIMPPEEIAKFMSKDYKDVAESSAYHALSYLKEKLNIPHQFNKGFSDLLKGAKEVFYVGINNSDPFMERVDPRYFNHDHSPDIEFIEDGDWACRKMRMSYTEVYDRLYDKMTEKQLDRLMEISGQEPNAGRYGKDAPAMDYTHITMKTVGSSHDETFLDSNIVDMWHVAWKSYKKIGFLTYQDENGQIQETVVSEDYMKTGMEIDLEWRWVIEVWEGYRIGEDLYVGIQPIEYQHISADNPNSQKLPYFGVIYNDNKSLVSIMKPLQYMYIIIWYRLELALARDKGKVITMDITQIPKSMNIDPAKWMHYLSAIGVNFVNPYEDGWDIPGREGGKAACWAPGTKIMLSDGRLKNVEDIRIGDKLMGPDWTPRTVLELHSGIDDMYSINPKIGGEPHVVNSNHIVPIQYRHHNTVIDTEIKASELMLLSKKKTFKSNYFLKRAGAVEFNKQSLEIDPYILGLWIGDGCTGKSEIVSQDIEIINSISDYAILHNMDISIIPDRNIFRVNLKHKSYFSKNGIKLPKKKNKYANFYQKDADGYYNEFKKHLNSLGILNKKDIPEKYIYGSREDRLQLLAGLIDTDGYYDKKDGYFTIVQTGKRKDLAEKIAFLSRSLGFRTSLRYNNNKKYGTMCTISIMSGQTEIPTRVKRKQAIYRESIRNNKLTSAFDISYVGRGEFYGFGTDGDHLLLHEDFTITHNSFNQIASLDLTMANVIGQYIEIMSKIEEMISEISGVSRQRQGSISSNELVGNVERSVVQSAHITESIFWLHNQCKKNVLRGLLNTAKEAWRDSNKTNLQYILNDATRTFLTLADNFFYEDFDIFVSDSTKDMHNLDMIKNLYQPAMQNGATLLDIANIMTLENVTEIKSVLKDIEDRRMQMQKEMEEAEAQRQQQLVAMQNEVKQQEIAVRQQEMELEKYKIDSDNQTRITVAQLGAYKFQENLDADNNGIPDPVEIGNLALKRNQLEADIADKQMQSSIKQSESIMKQNNERAKISNQREAENRKAEIEKQKIALEEKKLSAAKALQAAKDKAAMEREKIKAKTAIKNRVSGEK